MLRGSLLFNMSTVAPLDFRTLTDDVIATIVTPTLQQNKNRQGHFFSNPKMDGKDVIIGSCIVSAKGFGLSGPRPEYDIKGYSMPVSLQNPCSPPTGVDGKPDTTTYNTRKKIIDYFTDSINNIDHAKMEHQYFQMLLRFQKWFRQLVKSRSMEFLDEEDPTDKELDNKVTHILKFPKQPNKYAEVLQYGPKFQPEIREAITRDKQGNETKTGYQCEAFGPNGDSVNIDDLIGRRFTCMITAKLASVWKMTSTGQCGMKWECLRVDVIEYFDTAVKIQVNRNMYDECPEVDLAMIEAVKKAEAESLRKRMREEQEQEDNVPPPTQDEPEQSEVEPEVSEAEEESAPKKKKTVTRKKK